MDRSIKPDIIARIRIFKLEDGGRNLDINSALEYISCPALIENKYYDCRILLFDFNEEIKAGTTFQAPIKFLFSEKVLNILNEGDKFGLYDLNIFAEVEVQEVVRT